MAMCIEAAHIAEVCQCSDEPTCVSEPCSGVWTAAQPGDIHKLPIGLTLEKGNILVAVVHKPLTDTGAELNCVADIGQCIWQRAVLQSRASI